MLPLKMREIKEYIDSFGVNHFSKWFNKLNSQAAAKVTVYLTRIQQGNFSRVESVGEGVFECRIDFGPGYRIYFGIEGEKIILLLMGGTKKRQQKNIQQSHQLWLEYKKRAKEG